MLNNKEKIAVLIVDDNAENHEIMASFFRDLNIICDHAFDCIEAVTLCSTHPADYYSLILMDINLPHINGIETSHKLRNAGVSSPIIAVTAMSQKESSRTLSYDIFESMLHKPFSFHDLYSAVIPYAKGTLTNHHGKTEANAYETPVNVYCDFSQGIHNMGGSKRLFQKHANNFKANNADLCPRLTALITDKQYSQAAFICHSVKGLSGMLGFTGLYNHIISLEELMHAADAGDIKDYEISLALSLIDNDIRNICKIQF